MLFESSSEYQLNWRIKASVIMLRSIYIRILLKDEDLCYWQMFRIKMKCLVGKIALVGALIRNLFEESILVNLST